MQMVASALIKSEKRISKIKLESKEKMKEFKSILRDYEAHIKNVEQKKSKLEVKLLKTNM